MTLGDSKVRKWRAKVRQMVPKGSQKIAKGNQKGAKGSQKGAKGRPKCIQKSIFGKGSEKVTKNASPHGTVTINFGPHFQSKMH